MRGKQISFDKFDLGVSSKEALHPVLAQRLLVAVNDQDATCKFLKLPLSRRDPESGQMEDPARQELFLLTREALATFMRLGMRDAAIQAILQRSSWNVPSLSSRPLGSSLLNFTNGFLQVSFGVLGHLGLATTMVHSSRGLLGRWDGGLLMRNRVVVTTVVEGGGQRQRRATGNGLVENVQQGRSLGSSVC